MTANEIHTLLDEGAILNVKASGVTFVCVNNPKLHRQEAIEMMKEGVDEEDRVLDIVRVHDNPYDKFAMRLDYEGNDVGYIPKNMDVGITPKRGGFRRAYGKDINKILCEYTGNLEAEVDGIYGGGNGKHLGFAVNIYKV